MKFWATKSKYTAGDTAQITWQTTEWGGSLSITDGQKTVDITGRASGSMPWRLPRANGDKVWLHCIQMGDSLIDEAYITITIVAGATISKQMFLHGPASAVTGSVIQVDYGCDVDGGELWIDNGWGTGARQKLDSFHGSISKEVFFDAGTVQHFFLLHIKDGTTVYSPSIGVRMLPQKSSLRLSLQGSSKRYKGEPGVSVSWSGVPGEEGQLFLDYGWGESNYLEVTGRSSYAGVPIVYDPGSRQVLRLLFRKAEGMKLFSNNVTLDIDASDLGKLATQAAGHNIVQQDGPKILRFIATEPGETLDKSDFRHQVRHVSQQVHPGEELTLLWDLDSDPQTLSIDGAESAPAVTRSGALKVKPRRSCDYRLVASDADGKRSVAVIWVSMLKPGQDYSDQIRVEPFHTPAPEKEGEESEDGLEFSLDGGIPLLEKSKSVTFGPCSVEASVALELKGSITCSSKQSKGEWTGILGELRSNIQAKFETPLMNLLSGGELQFKQVEFMRKISLAGLDFKKRHEGGLALGSIEVFSFALTNEELEKHKIEGIVVKVSVTMLSLTWEENLDADILRIAAGGETSLVHFEIPPEAGGKWSFSGDLGVSIEFAFNPVSVKAVAEEAGEKTLEKVAESEAESVLASIGLETLAVIGGVIGGVLGTAALVYWMEKLLAGAREFREMDEKLQRSVARFCDAFRMALTRQIPSVGEGEEFEQEAARKGYAAGEKSRASFFDKVRADPRRIGDYCNQEQTTLDAFLELKGVPDEVVAAYVRRARVQCEPALKYALVSEFISSRSGRMDAVLGCELLHRFFLHCTTVPGSSWDYTVVTAGSWKNCPPDFKKWYLAQEKPDRARSALSGVRRPIQGVDKEFPGC